MTEGIPYFPLDVHLDDKFDLIEAEFGLKGFALIVKLYQKIYGGFGYYCEWTRDVALLFSRKVGEGYSVVSEIVSAAIKRGIFDKDLYDRYSILTSNGIQKRYFEAVSRRKEIKVKSEYLLVNVTLLSGNVNILSENVNILGENVNILKQRKEKESKAEYSKGEERTPAPSTKDKPEVTFSKEEIQSLADEFGKETAAEYTERVKAYCAETGKRYKDYAQTARKWIKEDLKNAEFSKKGGKTRVKKTRFSNYTDTNRIDYEAYERRIFADMMDEKEGK